MYRKEKAQSSSWCLTNFGNLYIEDGWVIIRNDPNASNGVDQLTAVLDTEAQADSLLTILNPQPSSSYTVSPSKDPVTVFEFGGEGDTARKIAESAWRDIKNSEGPLVTVIMPNGVIENIDLANAEADEEDVDGDNPESNFTIPAEVHSDDYLHEVDFDAVDWFKQATPDEILTLAECGWGGDYPADAVAEHFDDEEHEEIVELFKYTSKVSEAGGSMGFECHIERKPAVDWLRLNRPDVYVKLSNECKEDIDERDDADGKALKYGRCDTCGAPCDERGCTNDRGHEIANI